MYGFSKVLIVRISIALLLVAEESKWPQAQKLLTFLQQQGPPKCKRQVEGWVDFVHPNNDQNIAGAASGVIGGSSEAKVFSKSVVQLVEASNLKVTL